MGGGRVPPPPAGLRPLPVASPRLRWKEDNYPQRLKVSAFSFKRGVIRRLLWVPYLSMMKRQAGQTMVRNTLCSAVYILDSQNEYSRAEGITDQ